MTTQKQLIANRRNAKCSTGPTTDEGRQRSRLNALKHGLAAQEITIMGEDPEELDKLYAEFEAAQKPADAVDADLVHQMTVAAWKLRRIRRIEAQLFEDGSASSLGNRTPEYKEFRLILDRLKGSEKALIPDDTQKMMIRTATSLAMTHLSKIDARIKRAEKSDAGRVFRQLAGNQDAITQLLRYEASAEKAYYRALFALERRREARMQADNPPRFRPHVNGDERLNAMPITINARPTEPPREGILRDMPPPPQNDVPFRPAQSGQRTVRQRSRPVVAIARPA